MKRKNILQLSSTIDLDREHILGKGATGTVYKGRIHNSTNQDSTSVAIKVIKLSSIDNEVAEYLLEMEKYALMNTSSPYLNKGIKILENKDYCFMIMEYCNQGTLKHHMKKNGQLKEEQALQMLKKLLEGFQVLIQQGVIHRDLKPANIMLHNDEPKIIDFGYAEVSGFKKPKLEYNVGSPSYMAPQSFRKNIYNQKTQIWALGVILHELLTGRTLDSGENMEIVFTRLQKYGLHLDDNLNWISKRVINWCLSLNPKKRPTCEELLRYLNFKLDGQQSILKQGSQSHLLSTAHSFILPSSRQTNASLKQPLELKASKHDVRYSIKQIPSNKDLQIPSINEILINSNANNGGPYLMEKAELIRNRNLSMKDMLPPRRGYASPNMKEFSPIKEMSPSLFKNRPTLELQSNISPAVSPSKANTFNNPYQINTHKLKPFVNIQNTERYSYRQPQADLGNRMHKIISVNEQKDFKTLRERAIVPSDNWNKIKPKSKYLKPPNATYQYQPQADKKYTAALRSTVKPEHYGKTNGLINHHRHNSVWFGNQYR